MLKVVGQKYNVKYGGTLVFHAKNWVPESDWETNPEIPLEAKSEFDRLSEYDKVKYLTWPAYPKNPLYDVVQNSDE